MTATIRAHNEGAAAVWGIPCLRIRQSERDDRRPTGSCRGPLRPSTWREMPLWRPALVGRQDFSRDAEQMSQALTSANDPKKRTFVLHGGDHTRAGEIFSEIAVWCGTLLHPVGADPVDVRL